MIARWTLALIVLGRAAIAAAAPVAIEWSAPSGCPERERVVQRIERELGPLVLEDGPRVEASLAVVHDDDATWRLHLAIHKDTTTLGERDVTGASCDQVIDAAALIVALAIHENAAAAPPTNHTDAPATAAVALAPH